MTTNFKFLADMAMLAEASYATLTPSVDTPVNTALQNIARRAHSLAVRCIQIT